MHSAPPTTELDASAAKFDILETLQGARKFVIRHALLVTSLVWFLGGAQISLSLFVAQEPPRFPLCQPGQANCHENIPLDPNDCTTPYHYLRPGISIVSTYDISPMLCDSRPWHNVAWIHSALFLGMLVGALTIAPLADRKGRRPVLTLGVLGLMVTAFYSTMAPTVYMYGLARFLVGCSISASSLPSMAILSEITLSRKRQWIVAVQATSFCIAAGYVAVLACIIPSWQILTVLVTFPAVFFVCGIPCCGGVYIESPRWLAAKGRMDEAFSTWLRIGRISQVAVPEDLDLDGFVKNELQAIHERPIKTDSELEEELSLMSVRQMVTPDTLFKAFRMFPTSIWLWVSMWIWIVCAFVYYGVLLDFGDLITSLRIEGWETALLSGHNPRSFQTAAPAHPNATIVTEGPLMSPIQVPQIPSHQAASIRKLLADNEIVTAAVAAIRATESANVDKVDRKPFGSVPSSITPRKDLKEADQPDPNLRIARQTAQDEISSDLPNKNTPDDFKQPEEEPEGGQPPEVAHSPALLDGAAFEDKRGGVDESGDADARDIIQKDGAASSTISGILDRERAAAYMKYLNDVGSYVKNGSIGLYQSAKHWPEEAERLYDDLAMQKRLDQFYSDVSAQFTPDDPMAVYWKKMRLEGFLVLISFGLEIPAYAIAMLLAGMRRIGRKRTTSSLLTGGGCFISMAFLAQFAGLTGIRLSITTLGFVVLGRCCVASVFMLLYLYSAELFPTSIRGSSLGLFSASARIGCIFASPLATYLNGLQNGAALCFFGVLCLSAALLSLDTLPETIGQPLYDTLDTLDDVYTRNDYADKFFSATGIRFVGFIGRATCCLRGLFHRCLALPGDSEATSFEAKGHAWLKRQWKKSREDHQRSGGQGQFQPISDGPQDSARLASASTVRTFELGELDDSYDVEDSQRRTYNV